MNIFVIIATLVFLFLSVIWGKSDWINLMLKIAFIVMTFYGAYLIFSLDMLPSIFIKEV